MKRTKRAFNLVCVAFLTLFFIAVVTRVFTLFVLQRYFGINNQFTKIILFDVQTETPDSGNPARQKVDWASLYPFTGEDGNSAERKAKESRVKRIIGTIKDVESSIDSYTSDHLVGHYALAGSARFYERIIGWNYVASSEYNGTVRTADGYLTWVAPRIDVKGEADSVKAFSEFCEECGTSLLFVAAPDKVCRYSDADVSGVIDFSNQNADDFLSLLSASGVENYDLREILHREGREHHQLFFRTDHHWRPETGLWAAGTIAAILNRNHGFNIDLSRLDPALFTSTVYPKFFLGVQGKKMTTLNAEPEDFSLLYPNYQTAFHYEVLTEGINTDGDFSIMYDMDCVGERNFYREDKSPYSTYAYDNQPLERIENKLVDNNNSVLIIHDSFGNCVFPFLALGTRFVDSIDLRFFDGSIQSYIRERRPDVVIVTYNAHILGYGENSRPFAFR